MAGMDQDAAREGAWSRASIARTPRGWRVRVALADPRPAACFVKLERPRERALGFFDDSGWLRASVMSASPPPASARARTSLTAAPAAASMGR